MLTKKQINEIREHLENAKNPVFYYDNDADGLCSYVLLRRFIDRGKGIAVRSFPDLNANYAKRAQELNADYVFVLDKPIISREFIEEIIKIGLPIVWIDHHSLQIEKFEKEFDNFFVYNPARNKGKNHSEEPVTYWSYQIASRKEDIWLALIGCIADHHLPEFASEFEKIYPEFWKKGIKKPFDAYYETEIGKIAQALNFGLKDSVTNVVKLQNFLISLKSPGEVFQENIVNHAFRKKYEEIKNKYDSLLEKAKNSLEGEILFFEYSGDLSISSDLSNQLSHIFQNKIIIVAYKNGAVANISIRGDNAKKILEKVLQKVEGSGGGHDKAVGARIKVEDLQKFRELFKNEIEK